MDINPLRDFLTASHRNAWLVIKPFNVYVRKAYRLIEGDITNTLDIANIERPRHDKTGGRGELWVMLEHIQTMLARIDDPHYVLYFENVLNTRLANSLRKRGCIEIPDLDTRCPSFYLTSPMSSTVKSSPTAVN